MKRISIIILALLLVSGCSTAMKETDSDQISEDGDQIVVMTDEDTEVNTGEIDENDVTQVISAAEILVNLSDFKSLTEKSEIIALVRIEEITGAYNYNPLIDKYVYPYTYGTLKVIECYKGSVSEEASFKRLGGIISTDLYLLSEPPAARQKLQREGNLKKYVKCYFEDDIAIESGKDYLVLMHEGDFNALNPDEKIMDIDFLQAGLREYDRKSNCVLNNITGEWEDLNTLIAQLEASK